ncbi:MAG: hypothetical protein N4A68_03520 [Maledivibacter sp.]|jgi:hypothetical protein|nr:hypothetical protein [Maledivibacter sp.]
MNEDKLIELLNNMDDDLIEEEIDKLMNGVEIDMDSIKKKAHQKLNNNNKKGRGKKKLPYVAAACLCLLTITTVYADDISEAIKSFFNKTPVYSTIVDGDAYYLKESHTLNNDIKIESVMVSEGKLEMELTSDLSLSELGDINIIPKNNPDIIYFPGGYSGGDGEEKNEYFLSFMNKTENNYNIKPFKDFQFTIAGNSYDVSLEEAKSLDSKDEIHISNNPVNNVEGVNIGAKVIKENEKLNIQLVSSFKDKNLKLVNFGKPTEETVAATFEDLGENGVVTTSTGNQIDSVYVFDEIDNKYILEIPQDSKGYPVSIFETDAPKDKGLTLKLPSIIASYDGEIDSLSFSIPDEGEATLNKEIDFKIQKAIVKNIKRVSPTSAEIEFELNTNGDENINIRSFNFYSTNIKKISTEFSGNKAIMNLELDEKLDTANIEISYPDFVMNGDWVIDLK